MYSDVTGQISTHGASLQWLQRCTLKLRRVLGNSPFSMYFTQVRFTPIGTLCSLLQATVQAWHPIQARLSIANPNLIMRLPVGPLRAFTLNADNLAEKCRAQQMLRAGINCGIGELPIADMICLPHPGEPVRHPD